MTCAGSLLLRGGKALRRRLRINKRASSLTHVNTSLRPCVLDDLRRHEWSLFDLQYIVLGAFFCFEFFIIDSPGFVAKSAIALLLGASLTVPATRQFFLPFLPIACWLILFYASRFIPANMRPPISVKVLPALENILYGANLSNILSRHTNTFLDILAWLPYGIVHFAAPFVCSAVIFTFAPPGTLPVFAKGFGYMNLIGVFIQIVLPCSPPWYESLYGLAPANYAMTGSPGGLARIDVLFGGNTYTSTFTASPVVFGAFPSLHAGCATIEALFLSHLLPRMTPLFYGYVLWIWWATMYLTHHYFVDLIGGSCLSVVVFFILQQNFLPRTQAGRRNRWEYEYVLLGEASTAQEAAMSFNPSLELQNASDEETSESSRTRVSHCSGSGKSSSAASSVSEDSWDDDTLAEGSREELKERDIGTMV